MRGCVNPSSVMRRSTSGTWSVSRIQFVDTMNELIGVHAQFFGLSAPEANLDVSETVFTAEFHGKLDTLDVDPGVGEDTGQIVQGRQTNPAAGTDEQGVVLRMSARAHDQPVEGN